MTQLPALGPDIDVPVPPNPFEPPPLGQDKLYDLDILTKTTLRGLAQTPAAALIEGLIYETTVNVVVGDSGLGKTPWLEQMAICLATGTPFLGLDTQKSKVLFCDAESAGSHFVKYISRLESFLGVQAPEDSIGYYMRNLRPRELEECAQFEDTLGFKIEAFRPQIVIVDCLRPFWPDVEGEAKVAARVMKALRGHANHFRCAMVVVHHRRKASRNPKVEAPDLEKNAKLWLEESAGSKAIINQTDCRLGIDKAKGAGTTYPNEDTYVFAGFSKHEGDILPHYFERVHDSNGRPRGYKSTHPAMNTAQANVFNSLPDVYSFSDVQRVLNTKSKRQADVLIKLYRDAGLVSKLGAGNQTRYRKEVDHADASV